jgi:tripartite-type tricarboxylate transporter receptor subunit TctC
MNLFKLSSLRLGLVLLGAALTWSVNAAETPEQFYKGKQIDLYASAISGGNGVFARPLAHYMRQYLPGQPNIVMKEMLGAGGLVLANYIGQIAPKDGLVLATVNRGILVDPLLKTPSAAYDASKFSLIGSLGPELAICFVNADSPANTIQKAQERDVILGSVGPTTITATYPHLLNATINTRFKIIAGYQTTQEIMVAMERREVEGMCVSYGTLKTNRPDWIPNKKVTVLIQFAFKPHPELKDVPTLDGVKDPTARNMLEFYTLPDEVARPYFGPPGIPADRLNALRRAFDAAVKDPELMAEETKLKLELDPMSGEEAERKLKALYAIPESTIQQVITALEKQREINAIKR